jgi:hypothetical protein
MDTKNLTFSERGVKIETILRKVELPIVPSADCQEELRQTRLGSFFRLHDSFVCAGGERGKDTCQVMLHIVWLLLIFCQGIEFLFHLKISMFHTLYYNSCMGVVSDDLPCRERDSYKIAMLLDFLLESNFCCSKLIHTEVQPMNVATPYTDALFLQLFMK